MVEGIGRRDFLKFLAGLGLGTVGAELYERLYNIPSLEKRFRGEVEYWMEQYNSAKDNIHRLEEKVSSLDKTLKYQDELERESTSAISAYEQKIQEAIEGLRKTIEKYKVILGDERVAFENSSLRVLEDLKVTREKLLKVLPYFPLIKNLNFTPTRVVNDKVYDLNVSLEIISPLNSLEEVKVKLIPVEYEYFITEYGMRKEDYPLVFPPEEKREFKLKPKGLEQEIFSVDFTDLKGGREYIISVEANDTAKQIRREEIKTPYIREFENLGKLLYGKGIVVAATYFPLYPVPHSWTALEPMAVHPLLGKYDVRDPIVNVKHIDWATSYGLNTFFFSWPLHWGEDSKKILNNIEKFLDCKLSSQMYYSFQVEGVDTVMEWSSIRQDGWKLILSNRSDWEKIITGDQKYVVGVVELKQFLKHPNYLKVGEKPIIFLFNTARLYGNVSGFVEDVKKSLDSVYLMANYVDTWAASSTYTKDRSGGWLLECEASGECELINVAKNFDIWTVWAAGWYTPIKDPLSFYYPLYLNEAYSVWNNLSKKYSKTLVPSIIPGFINLRDRTIPQLSRDAGMFSEFIKTALRTSYSPFSGVYKIIKIDSFNEFGEATGIEPTQEEGFNFLQELKRYLNEI